MTNPKIIKLAQSLTDEQWADVFDNQIPAKSFYGIREEHRGSDYQDEFDYMHERLLVGELYPKLLTYVRELADLNRPTLRSAVSFDDTWCEEFMNSPLGRAVLRELERRAR